jgi:NADH-quinone oxidoreductase subunit J
MLVNLKRPPEDHSAPQRRPWLGFALTGAVLAELAAILVWGGFGGTADASAAQSSDLAVNNVERIGMLLYTDYLIPFEVASMLLLVAMVGAIILAKREL